MTPKQIAAAIGGGATQGIQNTLQQQQEPKQKGRFWQALGEFWQAASQPQIPRDIVDTTPPQQPQNNAAQVATYAGLGVLTLGGIALLIYLIKNK